MASVMQTLQAKLPSSPADASWHSCCSLQLPYAGYAYLEDAVQHFLSEAERHGAQVLLSHPVLHVEVAEGAGTVRGMLCCARSQTCMSCSQAFSIFSCQAQV